MTDLTIPGLTTLDATKTDAQVAAEVAKAVENGTAPEPVAFLAKLLPKSAHGKIPYIIANFEGGQEGDYPIGDNVAPGGPLRTTIETVEAYGLTLDLDAAGLATRIHCDRGFTA